MLNNIDLYRSNSVNFYLVLYRARVPALSTTSRVLKIHEKNPDIPINK